MHDKAAPELAVDEGTQALFDEAVEVGRRAREYVPGGVLIDFPPWEHAASVAATRAALSAGADVIYEAGFLADDVFVAADILVREPDGFTLVEVKMGLGVKPEHLADAAIQTYVARRSGVDVRRLEIMHLSRDCVFPNLSNLFVREEVTDKVERLLPAIPDEIAAPAESGPRRRPTSSPPARMRGRSWRTTRASRRRASTRSSPPRRSWRTHCWASRRSCATLFPSCVRTSTTRRSVEAST
ncbi:MAG: hypothetical protein NUW01_12390 [Gemmatimonadaceae bacterium]|nr:hypothetical protein [Gemmatimonadaceae bacterium]